MLITQFYDKRWTGSLLQRVFNSWLKEGLHRDQTKAIIALLPKTEGIIRDPSKIRPISLLNKDYRIFMKVLANRIKPLLKDLIHPDQTGFIPGRFIIDNIATVKLGVENLSKSQIITLLDCAKAFDRVGHKYLWSILEQYNFPKELIDCLRKTYRNSISSIKLNGCVSNLIIQNDSGVRQGCPLAPFLFVLSIEPLLRVLRIRSKGFKVAQQPKKVNAHADDIALFSQNEEDQKLQLDIVSLWAKASGGQLNLDKCVSFTKIQKKEVNQIGVATKPERYLGYYFQQKFKNNLDNQIEKLITKLTFWKKWKTVLINKLTILKTYAQPTLIYFMYCTDYSKLAMQKIDHVLSWFLWSSDSTYNKDAKYPPKMNIERLSAAKNYQGSSILDLKKMWKALQASLLLRALQSDEESTFHKILKQTMKEVRISRRWDATIFDTHTPKMRPTSWLQQICYYLSESTKTQTNHKIGQFYGIHNEKHQICYIILIKQIVRDVNKKPLLQVQTRDLYLQRLQENSLSQKALSNALRFSWNLESMFQSLKILQIPTRIKNTWFQILHYSLKVRTNIHFADHNPLCPMCEQEDEDIEHLFGKCCVMKFLQIPNWHIWPKDQSELTTLLTTHYLIWKTRCEFVLSGTPIVQIAKEQQLKKLLKETLSILYSPKVTSK